MPESYDLLFASSNRHKYAEARAIAAGFGVGLEFAKCALPEIQSDSIREISAAKARAAFERFGEPVLAEDDGLFVDALGGFPGPFSSYVFGSIGNGGILKLLGRNRRARFVSAVTFCSKDSCRSFEGTLRGMISESAGGDGWGYDPIFVPENHTKTFAQIDTKNLVSHRSAAVSKFSRWYRRARRSTC